MEWLASAGFNPAYYGTDWISSALAVTGTYLLGNKSRKGFVFNVLACFFAVGFSVLAKSVPLAAVNATMLVLNLRGYLKWAAPAIPKD